MIDAQMIRTKLEEELEGSGNYLVDLKVSSANKILIEVDNNEHLSIEDCINISRYVEHDLLDRDQEDFELEVTSPGLDKPFKVFRQYEKNIGREVSINFVDESRAKLKGLLKEVGNNSIVVETKHKERLEGKKKKVWVIQTHDINFDEIKATKVVISF